MPKLKQLSGDDVIKILESFGFVLVGQKGSHVKLRRVSEAGIKQTLTVPRHAELDKGTLRAIYSQALKYISDSEIRSSFYSD